MAAQESGSAATLPEEVSIITKDFERTCVFEM